MAARSRGQGRKGRGSGQKPRAQPSFDVELPAPRQDYLSRSILNFHGSSQAQLSFPSSLSGVERRFVHEEADRHGLVTQSFGEGARRRLSVFRKQDAVALVPASRSALPSEGTASGFDGPPTALGVGDAVSCDRLERYRIIRDIIGDFLGDFAQERGDMHRVLLRMLAAHAVANSLALPTRGASYKQVLYSVVVLDSESQHAVRAFADRSLKGEIPQNWKVHCTHMTICRGPLSQPKTADNHSVADTWRKRIGGLQAGEHVEMRVVSVGRADGVLAVGTVGGISCNRNPHIAVACGPHVSPKAANLIGHWEMVPACDHFVIRGIIQEQDSGANVANKNAAPPAKAQVASKAKLQTDRREELSAMVADFVAGPESKITFPASLSGHDRKYLNQRCEQYGCTSQAYRYGTGKERVLTIFKGTRFQESVAAAPTASESDRPIADVDSNEESIAVSAHRGSPKQKMGKPPRRQRGGVRQRAMSDYELEPAALDPPSMIAARMRKTIIAADEAASASRSVWQHPSDPVVEIVMPGVLGFLDLPVLLRACRSCHCWVDLAAGVQVDLQPPQAIEVLRFCLLEVLSNFDDERVPYPLSAIYGDMCKVGRRSYTSDGHCARLAVMSFQGQVLPPGRLPHHVSWPRACGDLKLSGLKTLEKMGRFFQTERLIDVSLQRLQKRVHHSPNFRSLKEWQLIRVDRQHSMFLEHTAWQQRLHSELPPS